MKNSKKVLVGLLAVSMTAVLSACQNPISSSISSTSSSEGVTSTNSSIISTESTPNTSSEVSSESSTISSIEVVAVKTEIATVEDFLAFRAINNAEDAALDFKLTADIDLTGVTLPAPKIVLTGSFDGQGHTIKNAAYENANSKTGILFAKVAGGIVKNVNFFACTISSSAESIAILAGEINGGNVTNCEFNNCKVDTTGNYGGIVYARSEGSNMQVTLDQITVKNNCLVSCGQYGDSVDKFLDNTMELSENVDKIGKGKHIFSHIEWHMTGYHVLLSEKPEQDDLVWVTKEEMEAEYAVPSAFQFMRDYLFTVEEKK